MAIVKVPIAGTVGKAVRIESAATIGATIGLDLRLPDGSVPTFAQLAFALSLGGASAEENTGNVSNALAPTLWSLILEIPPIIGAIADLVDPGVDAIPMWDDSASELVWLTGIPNSFITQGSVTQHQAALSILETQIPDGAILARVASAEAITGAWTFATAAQIELLGGTDLWIRDGAFLRIYDAGDTDFVQFSHDGGDFLVDATSTGAFIVSGISELAVVNYAFDVDQTVGAGQDNYVLTYDNATGLISLEAAPGGGGVPTQITVANEVADATSFPLFATAATGDLGPKTNAGLTFDATTANLNSTLIAGIANANLLDKSAIETISAEWTFTDDVILSGTQPFLRMVDTDSDPDEKNWILRLNSNFFTISAAADAFPATPVSSALTIRRNGTVFIEVELIATDIILTGDVDVTGALTAVSYGGITQANLVDKSAVETISGAWVFSNILTMSGANIDFGDNQALNMRIENRTSDPGSPTVGEIWLRTDL